MIGADRGAGVRLVPAGPAIDLVAIGIEGIVSGNYLWPIIFIPLGVFVSMLPIKVRLDRCIACMSPLGPGQAICKVCGAPQM